MNVSPDFTPPIKLSMPYFLTGIFFYFSFSVGLVLFNLPLDFENLSFVALLHTYLLGFVMLSLFAAYMQFIPVIVEKNHIAQILFYFIYPIHIVGMGLLILGFTYKSAFLSYGSAMVLISMLLFAYDFLRTVHKSTHKKMTTNAIRLSILFLLITIVTGFIMALTFSGVASSDIPMLRSIHVSSIIIGFIYISIITVSMTLIPMFGLPRGYSTKPFLIAFSLAVTSILLNYVDAIHHYQVLALASNIALLLSFVAYLTQLYLFHTARQHPTHDVWAISLYIAFGFLCVTTILGVWYLFEASNQLLHALFLSFILGFIGFFITGNFYKIIPFLVWFEKFAPLIEEQPVPMLHDMVNTKLAKSQIYFTLLAVVGVVLSTLLQNSTLFHISALILLIGITLLAIVITKIVTIKT